MSNPLNQSLTAQQLVHVLNQGLAGLKPAIIMLQYASDEDGMTHFYANCSQYCTKNNQKTRNLS